MSPSLPSVYEGFADLTLLFGFLPSDITVIGVGWFLGLIFAFYLIFPFYCVLLKTRRRAWGAFVVSVLMNYAFGFYFDLGRSNIVYSFCYLMAGGLVYLYREELERLSRKYGAIALLMVLGSVAAYFLVGGNTVTMLLVSVLLLVYALGRTRGGYCEIRLQSLSVR